MKTHYKYKKQAIIIAACLLMILSNASCNKSSEAETIAKDKKVKSDTFMVADNKADAIKRTKPAKESDSNDLVINKSIDRESKVMTDEKSQNITENLTNDSCNTNKNNTKSTVTSTVIPNITTESKPLPEDENTSEKIKVWVVDQKGKPAWDEVVDNYDFPIGYDKEYYWIEGAGISEKYYLAKELNNRMDELADQGIPVSWGKDKEFVQTGYMKKTIHHPAIPEQGHWEWK